MISAGRILPVIGIALFCSVSLAAAQSTSPDVASLRGVRRVDLVIGTLKPELAAVVDTSSLRTEMEVKLREHGLTVFAVGDTSHIDAAIYLTVAPVHDSKIGLWALSVEVQVWQLSIITRLNMNDPVATTWSGGSTVIVGEYVVAQTVTDSASHAMDAFLNAWLQANPPSR